MPSAPALRPQAPLIPAANLLLPAAASSSAPVPAAAQALHRPLPPGAVAKPAGLQVHKLGDNWLFDEATYHDVNLPKITVRDFIQQYGFSISGPNQSSPSLQGQPKTRDGCITPVMNALKNLMTGAADSIASLFGMDNPKHKLLSVFKAMPAEDKARIINIMRDNAIANRVREKDLTDAFLEKTLAPQLIASALGKTINASGAKLIFINTDEGVFLIVAHNQRKGRLLQASNGATWPGESIAVSSDRYFLTELNASDIPKNPIVATALDQPLEILTRNALGATPEEMVTRILTGNHIYLNASATYVNRQPISKGCLDEAIAEINARLIKTKDLYTKSKEVFDALSGYQQRLNFLVPEGDLSYAERVQEGQSYVGQFLDGKEFRSHVPDSLWKEVFEPYQNAPSNIKLLMRALKEGVMELSQNTEVQALGVTDLSALVDERNQAHEDNTQGCSQGLKEFRKHTFDVGFGFVEGYLQQAKESDRSDPASALAKVLVSLKPSHYPVLTKVGPRD